MSNERSWRRCPLREIYAAITRQVSGKHVDSLDPHVALPRFLSDDSIGSQACSVRDTYHGKFAERFTYVMLRLFIPL